MKEFIEVHVHAPGKAFDGVPTMVNLDWVETFQAEGEHAVIFMAFSDPDYGIQDQIHTVESYDDIKRMIWRRL